MKGVMPISLNEILLGQQKNIKMILETFGSLYIEK